MAFSATFAFSTTDDDSLSYDPDLVVIDNLFGVTLLNLGGGVYTTSNPPVATQQAVMLSDFSGFTISGLANAGSALYFQINLSGVLYWYNATSGSWEVSDGSILQSNTAAVINTNASTLFADAQVFSPQYLSFRFRLGSNGSVAPSVASITMTGTWENGNPPVIDRCLLYCYLSDLVEGIPAIVSGRPTKLLVSAPQGFLNGSKFILPFTKSVTFDADGYAEISIIETETPGIPLEFGISYFDGRSVVTAKMFSAVVPNAPTASLNAITTAVPYSFG